MQWIYWWKDPYVSKKWDKRLHMENFLRNNPCITDGTMKECTRSGDFYGLPIYTGSVICFCGRIVELRITDDLRNKKGKVIKKASMRKGLCSCGIEWHFKINNCYLYFHEKKHVKLFSRTRQ